MYKVNLWLSVALFVLCGVALVLGGTSTLEDLLLEPLRQSAATAGMGLEGELTLDSAISVDAAAERASRAPVRNLFRESGGSKALRAEVQEILKEPVVEHSDKDAKGQQPKPRLGVPDFAWVADEQGRVLVSHISKAAKDSESALDKKKVAGLTGFADAMRGFARDGLLRFEKNAFRVAAAPIYDDEAPKGVLMMGWALDAEYAQALSSKLHAEVVFVINEDRVGDKITIGPKPIPAAKLKAVSPGNPFGTFAPKLLLPLPIDMPLLVSNAGRFVGDRRAVFGPERSVSAVVAIDRGRALVALANTQIVVLSVSLSLALFMAIMGFLVQRSLRRPMEIVLDHLSSFAQGTTTDLLPEEELSGDYVRLGKQINMILKGQTPGGVPKSAGKSAPVQARPTAPPAGTAGAKPLDFEGFAQENPPPALPPTAGLAPNVPPPVPGSEADESGLSGLFGESSDPLAAFRVPQKPPPPAPEFSLDDAQANTNATAAFETPQELLAAANRNMSPPAASPPAVAAPPPPPPPPDSHTDGATMVAQVPKELLQAASGPNPAASTPPLPPGGTEDPEQVHFRQTFREFMQTRQECGEDISELTYERFETKLIKTKQAIMDKYNPSSVRFVVHVKQGKAALKAVPVRD